MMPLLLVQLLTTGVCLALVYGTLCRAVAMDASTAHPVRLAFAGKAVAALGLALVPWVWPQYTALAVLALVVGVLAVQVVTARHWAHGQQPQQFVVPGRTAARVGPR